MLYDIRLRPLQLRAAADWSEATNAMADVELRVDDALLVVEQGDDRTAFDAHGSPANPPEAAADTAQASLLLTIFPIYPSGASGDALEEVSAHRAADLCRPLERAAEQLRRGIFANDDDPRTRATTLELTLELADV
jgi:hypothetical protein